MAYIYPSLKPRTTALPISKQTFAGGYQNAVLAMQKQQMPVGMDPLRWREQQRANARRLARVFSGGGGGAQAHDRPVNRGGFTPGIDPSYQQWQDQRYGAPIKPGFEAVTLPMRPNYEREYQMMQGVQPIMLRAGQPGGAGGVQPTMPVAPGGPPRPMLQQRSAVRGRTLPSMYPRPRYTTNV